MLKARIDSDLWLVQQPHHAAVSGFLAAHWGGGDGFARPGQFPGAADPDRWRDEVVLGIAEHDNGWWETEAMPRFSAQDGLPVGVGEAAPPTEENEFVAWIGGGLDRWRLGIARLAREHPYGALLISLHASWLYLAAFRDLMPDDGLPREHFVFGTPDVAEGLTGDAAATRAFLAEQQDVQADLIRRIEEDPAMAAAVRPEHLHANARLLQLMDSMSLYLALHDQDPHELADVPRASLDDRCTISWRRRDARTVELDPYPFAQDELVVPVPARVIPAAVAGVAGAAGAAGRHPSPITRLHGTPLRTLEFTFIRRGD